jgi:hypothetical protein
MAFGQVSRLAKDEEPGCSGGEARSRGRLGKMTRRKREITGLANEQDFPHLVELALPPGGFRGLVALAIRWRRRPHLARTTREVAMAAFAKSWRRE